MLETFQIPTAADVAETIRIKTLSLYPCGMVSSFVNFSKTKTIMGFSV